MNDKVIKSIRNAPEKTFCSGCSACVSICPQEAIFLKLNNKGFYEAVLEKDLCIGCGKCTEVCNRFQKTSGNSLYEAQHLAMQSSRKETVRTCSSGGIAYELGVYAINSNKMVVGCVYNNSTNKAEHRCIESLDELEGVKGSKYIQSNPSEAFKTIVKIAEAERKKEFIVFGTPCQISGFAKVAEKLGFRERVLLVEIFCHGISSYKIWDKQLLKIEQKLGGKPENVFFRYKKNDWHSYCIKAEKNGKIWYGIREKAEFWHVFFENVLLNDACMNCKERKENSLADIRVGDYWGHRFEKNKEGVSAVFALTEKGIAVLGEILEKDAVVQLEAGTAKEMLFAQNMSGYEIDEKHQEAMRLLDSGEDVDQIIRDYRKKITNTQKLKRILLLFSSFLPDGIRIYLRKRNSSRYTRQSKE